MWRGENDLRRANAATAHGLLRQQGGIALGHTSGPAVAAYRNNVAVHAAMSFS